MIKNANDNILHLTLREMQSSLLSKQFIIGIVCAIVILTVAGPFGTLDAFNVLERFAYWLIIAPCTFVVASFSSTLIVLFLSKFSSNKWIKFSIAGIITGFPVGITVWLFQFVLVPSFKADISFLLAMTSKTIPITFAINIVYASLSKNKEHPKEQDEHTKTDEKSDMFFNRIPKHLGRDIISLNAQDHYVHVTTSLGKELILMRLSDAVQELSEYEGIQTHRSWWVSSKHVIEVKSQNGKKQLRLSNDELVPVSRNFAENIQNL